MEMEKLFNSARDVVKGWKEAGYDFRDMNVALDHMKIIVEYDLLQTQNVVKND